MSQKILFLAHVDESGTALPKAAYEALGTALETGRSSEVRWPSGSSARACKLSRTRWARRGREFSESQARISPSLVMPAMPQQSRQSVTLSHLIS